MSARYNLVKKKKIHQDYWHFFKVGHFIACYIKHELNQSALLNFLNILMLMIQEFQAHPSIRPNFESSNIFFAQKEQEVHFQ